MEAEPWSNIRRDHEETLARVAVMSPKLLTELETIVDPSDFRNPFLGQVYGLACLLEDGGMHSPATLRTELEKRGHLKDSSELSDWIKFNDRFTQMVGEGSARYAAHELRRITQLEELRRACSLLAVETEQIQGDPTTIIEWARGKMELINLRSGQRLWKVGEEVGREVVETHSAALRDNDRIGMTTGFYELDELTGGLFPGQLWQIAGRSYMGKSTIALAFTQRQIERGNAVYFASYEMTNIELMERILADRSSISLSSFTKGRLSEYELQRVEGEVKKLEGAKLFLDDMPPDSVHGIKARVRLASNEHKVKLLVIDHLLLFPHKDRRIPRHQQLVDVTRELKQLAKELELTILLLNQLNADADGAEPTDKHYSESKAVLQNLDVSILIHRETKDSEDMLFKVTKNRKGAAGEIRMKFFGETQRVEDVPNCVEWEVR